MSLRVNGSGQYARTQWPGDAAPFIAPTSPFTLAGWVYVVSARSPSMFAGMSNANVDIAQAYTILGVDSNSWSLTTQEEVGAAFPSTPSTGQWRYTGFRWSGAGDIEGFWWDGTAWVTNTCETDESSFSKRGIWIGPFGSLAGAYWPDARFAHWRLWGTTRLSDGELAAERGSATPVRTSGLWADWPLVADGADTTANEYDLLIVGSPAWEAQPEIGGSVGLDAADAGHGHASESPSLSQAHAISPADGSHGHAAESPALSQSYSITPADAAHAQASESPALSQAHALAPEGSLHGQSADSPGVAQAHAFAPVSASHALSAESPTLTQSHALAPADASHAHAAESPSLVQGYSLTGAGAGHGHAAESPSITQGSGLAVSDAEHGQAADSPALSQAHVFSPADASHAGTAGSPSLTQAHAVAPARSSHAHSAATPDLTSAGAVAPDRSTHAHSASAGSLVQAYLLSVTGSVHAHTADIPAIEWVARLIADGASHGVTVGVVVLAVDGPGIVEIHPDHKFRVLGAPTREIALRR